jgi:Golgi apparatus protein 1
MATTTSRRNMTVLSLLAGALAGALAAGPARAEQACAADATRLCSSIPPGSGRVFFCLQSNWNDLSSECQKTITWAQNLVNEVTLDCQADAFAWCQGVPRGQGRVYACLASHRDEISSTCTKALATMGWFTKACSGDAARLCPGVPPGEGALLTCLVTQRNQLSDGCKAVFWP